MATNSLGTLNATLVAQRGLEILVNKLPIIGSIATDFSDTEVSYNQTITSRIPDVGTAQDYDPDQGFVPSNVSGVDVSVTLNKFKHATFEFKNSEMSSTNRNLIEDYAESFAVQIGDSVMSDICAIFTSGNYPYATTQAVSGANRKTIIIEANKELGKRKVRSDRFALFNSDLYAAVLSDDSMIDLNYGAGNTVKDAEPVLIAHGVKISEYADLPTAANLIGVVGAKDALVFASRTPADETAALPGVPAPGRISKVTDPRTGLSVQVREVIDLRMGKVYVTYALIYGVGKGNNKSLQRIKSA